MLAVSFVLTKCFVHVFFLKGGVFIMTVKKHNHYVLPLLVLMSTILFSAVSAFAWQKKFIFFNNSGRTVWHLYIKGSSYKGGYRDLLGSSFLPDGELKQYKYSGRHKIFDIMIVFREGDHVLFRRLDFRSLDWLTLTKKNGKYLLRTH